MEDALPKDAAAARPAAQGRTKFLIGGLMIVAAIIYLIYSSTREASQYFLTISELQSKGAQVAGQNLRVSGAVLGDTIQYDADNLMLSFTVANIPGDNKEIDAQGGLAAVLHAAVSDPGLPRLNVVYNGVKPDLLTNEAQAIMTGKLGEDGVFYADELLLKCPTKYQEALPQQAGE